MFAPCVWDQREAGEGRRCCQNLGPQPVDWSLEGGGPRTWGPRASQERKPGGAAGWWPRQNLGMLTGTTLGPAYTSRVDSESQELKPPSSAFHSDH